MQQPTKDVVMVAIAIGDRYLDTYNLLFRPSQEKYAEKHGYDFKVITDYMDDSALLPPYSMRSRMMLYFQKMLVCSKFKEYKYVIFVDCDVLINPKSPAIHLAYDFEDKIGIVDEYSQPTPEMRIAIQRKNGWETSAREYYKLADFDLDTTRVLNSGVIVMQPQFHSEFMDHVYATYMPKSLRHRRGPHFEQSSLGYELQTQNKAKIMSNEWNAIWVLHRDSTSTTLSEFYDNNFFVHFAGNTDFDKVYQMMTTHR